MPLVFMENKEFPQCSLLLPRDEGNDYKVEMFVYSKLGIMGMIHG